ncbi:MAG: Wzz/FepE/Etk N-terminal domain-containing protein [Patescibacteria group bacterium]
MTMDIAQLLERHWKTIAVSAVLVMVAAAALSFVRPLEYSSTMRLLIIQKAGVNLDPYTAIRSAERIADNLSQVIYTSVFYDKVAAAGFDIDRSYFEPVETKRRKQWADMVSTQVTHETGFLQISVYHKDKEQASEIARAVAFVLTTEGNQFIGGRDLEIRLVDTPLQSRFPVRPNIPLNAFLGAVIGVILSSLYLVVGEARRHRHTTFSGTHSH